MDPKPAPTSHSACSPFWITNIVLSFVNGISSNRRQKKDFDAELDFQKAISAQKIDHETARDTLERAFKVRQAEQRREHSEIQNRLRLNLDMQADELKMFIKGWPLKLSLQALQASRRAADSLPPALMVVIASHEVRGQGDPLARIYDGNNGIVDNVQSVLTTLGIPAANILRFKSEKVVTGGAAVANIFAMMSMFPTIVITPRVDRLNQRLILSVGCWYPSSKIPMQRNALDIEYNPMKMSAEAPYRIAKQKEIEATVTAVAAVANDIYALATSGREPIFPKYAADNDFARYPDVAAFIRREYSAAVDSGQNVAFVDGNRYNGLELIWGRDKTLQIARYIADAIKPLNI